MGIVLVLPAADSDLPAEAKARLSNELRVLTHFGETSYNEAEQPFLHGLYLLFVRDGAKCGSLCQITE